MYFFPHASSPAYEHLKFPKQKTPSPRKQQFQTENESTHTRNSSTGISVYSIESKEVPIWFSVFFGKPSLLSPQLDIARFNAKISERVFEPSSTPANSPFKSSSRTSVSSNVSLPRPGLLEEPPVVRALLSLCRSFEGEILNCVTEGCTICEKGPAQSLVHRPLCATRYGYVELSDFVEMHKLVSTVASHTTHITRRDEIDWSVGDVMSDRPYICALAVPVCSSEGECHRAATKMMQTYIEGIRDGSIKSKALDELETPESSSLPQRRSMTSHRSFRVNTARNEDYSGRTLCLRSPSIETLGSPTAQPYKIGATMFVGRPSLQLSGTPQRGQLSCSVFSSTWSGPALPGVAKNEADDAVVYCRIAGFYEHHILSSANYRCAVCSELAPARSLVHRPLLFVQTHRSGLQNESERRLIVKLSQFVQGRWSYPEMNAVMGGTTDAHVFDLVVPICESNTICAEVARTSAREFVKLLLPSDVALIFPCLDPDTDLSLMEDETVSDYVYKPEDAEVLVHRIGCDLLTMTGEERDEDPMDCSLTITKLRRWYELAFEEEEAKRLYLEEIGYKRTGDRSESDSDDSEIDDDIVWIYALNDPDESSSRRNSARLSHRELARQDSTIRKFENLSLFQPTLSLEFWKVWEAMKSSDHKHG
ncbi:uncharacterized protein P174DRAFT_453008 [Aspergillus novofumigatus IBT 16806]|uniref:Uncharacterized protein n=1 Tax=Aspergillus novofumigatus (strain IBT 16806) TaxID=1392255 RepID=A0A2I1C254_ASPN1|nr:uncharacterized protein P174DRAFT_453008 [Aspergillus novofumigatus IBT 16806]PKX91726.1 hypothetical protein P174DRAFT_453008 [Aspergillus novofumigatus IBT 16806]